MSEIHLLRIKAALNRYFSDSVNVDDLSDRSEESQEAAFLSRALAAYAIMLMSGCEPTTAADAVVDGFDDGGIDAIYYDRDATHLCLCQSKWRGSGNGSPSQSDVRSLIAGTRRILNVDISDLNDLIRAKEEMIREAAYESNARITIAMIHTGTDELASHPQNEINRYITEINTPVPVLEYHTFNQSRIYQTLTSGTQPQTINAQLSLTQWGFVDAPYQAYYGTIDARQLAKIWHDHNRSVLARNIRDFRGRTDVNAGLSNTLSDEPQHFWYFNNGLTLLCESIQKLPVGGSSREIGVFDCSGISVVNGAQTVGTIGTVSDLLSDIPEDARILVRLISVQDCPSGFDQRVTRATNTQNQIEGKDFASLDPNQRRIAGEFRLDQKTYSYRTGEPDPSPDNGCTLTEATIALACSQPDPALAVQVKNQIGRIWDDLRSEPYTLLFNNNTSAEDIWTRVKILRRVEEILKELGTSDAPRAELVAIHANRFILFRTLNSEQIKHHLQQFVSTPIDDGELVEIVTEEFNRLARLLDREQPNAYLASLFKTRGRVNDVYTQLRNANNAGDADNSELTLFTDCD